MGRGNTTAQKPVARNVCRLCTELLNFTLRSSVQPMTGASTSMRNVLVILLHLW